MFRLFIAAPLALLLSLVLFYGLALLTSMGNQLVANRSEVPDLNFLMVRQESDVELRQRHLPPEPQEIIQEQAPKMPQLQPMKNVAVQADIPAVDVPNIDVGIAVSLSPSLNSLSAPSLSFNTNPEVLSQTPPRYPQRALRRGLEGKVVIEFEVTKAGSIKPGSIKIIKSTPKGVFDKAVLKAIQRWRFATEMVNGQPVPYRARQELEFKLEK